jgi:hypothetical protein
MPFSPETLDQRRHTFLSLSSQIEGQLRDLYDVRYQSGEVTQASMAECLNVNRSVVNRRLKGYTNMTVETIADMVWSLKGTIHVTICAAEALCSNQLYANTISSSSVIGNPSLPQAVTPDDQFGTPRLIYSSAA